MTFSLCNPGWATTESIDNNLVTYDYATDSGVKASSYENWEPATIAPGVLTPLLKLPDSNSVVGIAINGVLLFAATSQLGYDAFFP